ncbi:Tol-Pal system protein TolB [Chlamydia sp. 17-3921]|uniref:Tol-Pal system protein TolB n=1 Tax=Chlamydia sp. 17-3921 TaxID=2675798 RepID=UPI00191AE6CE|nr:Tol-Pal system protein TolB [Chlamydia sp. 17-3921]
MLKRLYFGAFLFFVFHLNARDIEVFVSTNSAITPIQVSYHLESNDTKQQKYFQALVQIFNNDLALGDRLLPQLVKYGSPTSELQLSLYFDYPSLSVLLLRPDQEPVTLCSVQLSQNLSSDRQQIHLAADKVHYSLTGIPGISSGKIIFSLSKTQQSQELKQGELWSIDYDGGNLFPLTKDSSLSVTPKWTGTSPEAPYLYVSYKLGVPKIFLGSLKNTEGKKILSLKGNQFMPVFSAQKKLLAFIADTYGNPDLFIQPFSLHSGPLGKPQRLLNETFGTQGSPSFNPQGTKLVFVSNRDGRPRLYIMNLDPEPQAPRLLTKKYRNSSCPTWSLDGKKIAFCSVIKGVRQICIHDILTGEDRQLTTTPQDKESPSWAIDSQHLVFSAGNSGESELYLLSLITKKTKKIVIGPGEKRFPSWGNFSPQQIKKIL